MDSYEILGFMAALLGFLGFIPYIWKTWKGQIRPHIFSWYLWTLFNVVAGAAQWSDGGGAGAWVNLSGGLFTLIVAVLATINGGKKDIEKSDWYALYGAFIAMGLWYFTKDPVGAVILITVIDMIAFYPTFRKGWVKPHEDMLFLFILNGVKYTMSIMALQHLTITTVLFPASLVLTNMAFAMMLIYRRCALKNLG